MLVTRKMKNSLLLILMLAFSVQMVAQKSPSEQLFEAAVTRYVPAEKYVWNWRDAVLLKSFIDIARAEPQKREQVAHELRLSLRSRLLHL